MAWKDKIILKLKPLFARRWKQRLQALGNTKQVDAREIYRRAYWEGVVDAMDVGIDLIYQDRIDLLQSLPTTSKPEVPSA